MFLRCRYLAIAGSVILSFFEVRFGVPWWLAVAFCPVLAVALAVLILRKRLGEWMLKFALGEIRLWIEDRKLNFQRFCHQIEASWSWRISAVSIVGIAQFLLFVAYNDKAKWFVDHLNLGQLKTDLSGSWLWSLALLVAPVVLGGFALLAKWLAQDDDNAKLKLQNYLTVVHSNSAQETAKLFELDKDQGKIEPRDTLRARGIAMISNRIHNAFVRVAGVDDNKIKVTVFSVVGPAVQDLWTVSPMNQRSLTSLPDLQNPKSAFSICIAKKRVLVIPDIAQELRKGTRSSFIESSDNPDGAKGSLICFPVKNHKNEVVAAISIYCKESLKFMPITEESYKTHLEIFEADILDVLVYTS